MTIMCVVEYGKIILQTIYSTSVWKTITNRYDVNVGRDIERTQPKKTFVTALGKIYSVAASDNYFCLRVYISLRRHFLINIE